MKDVEARLKMMTNTANSLSSLLSVIREDGSEGPYLVIEHEDYGHVTELHPEDYPHHKEILRDAIEFASNQGDLPPWD
jgi:hypothetical protein